MEDYNIVANNILTPNGDGQNDLWVIENLSSYPINSLLIFDRTGRVIHSKINYANDWDGQNNGNFLPEDTYYYVITFDNGAIKKMGFITIIK
jgi:gliding motility-associated-like protein